MEPSRATSRHRAASPAPGTVFAINHNADNALITLRYRLKDADIADRRGAVRRGRREVQPRLLRHQGRLAGGPRQGVDELGLKAYALAAAPSVKTHPARAARIAILHHVEQHADRRLVAPGVRHVRRSLRLHRPADRRREREPARQVRRDHLRARRVADRRRRDADVAQPDSVEDDRPIRRTSARGRRPTTCGSAWASRASCTCASSSPTAASSSGRNSSADFAIQNGFSTASAPTGRQLHPYRRIAAAHEDRGRREPDRLRDPGPPRRLQRQRRSVQRQRDGWRGTRLRRRRWRRRRRARRRRSQPAHRPRHRRRRGTVQGRPAYEGSNLTPVPPRATSAAVAVRAADRRTAQAESGEPDPAGVPPARGAALRGAELPARVGPARRRQRHRATRHRR